MCYGGEGTEGKLYTETHDTSEEDARLCNGRPKPASALGLVGEADAKPPRYAAMGLALKKTFVNASKKL